MPRSTIKGPQDGAITFNEGSADVDFRVESNGNANMLMVNGGDDRVGIGTNSPAEALEVSTTADADYGIKVANDDTQAFVKVQSGGTALYGGNTSVNFVSGGSFATAMIIDANGQITKPLQPAFHVINGADNGNIATNNTEITVNFSTESFDVNSDFNTTNFTFTAPVTGKYQFNVSLSVSQIDTAATQYIIRLNTSNRNYHLAIDPEFGADTLFPFSISALADMDASDTAIVTIAQNGGTAQTDVRADPGSHFSGFLAC